jgi:hypothetical protein
VVKTGEWVPAYRAAYADALNHGLEILGVQVSGVVANYVSRKYGMNMGETFSDPVRLSEALERTLGSGALLIERRIVRSIYRQLSLPLTDADFHLTSAQDFKRYVIQSQALFSKR